MTQDVPVASEPLSLPARRKAQLAASIGNTVEWFDFAVYGYLAVRIGAVFFPSDDPTASLLASFAVFAAAFLVRPLGGFVFGPLGDRIGRRTTLAVVIMVMSAATFLVGCLPGHDEIGAWAPLLLVLLRVVQGLSAGGEVGGSATYLAEIAPHGKRGLITSAIEFSTLIGLALGSLVVLGLTATLADSAMNSWGWRIPFLVGGLLGLIGLYIRLRLAESPAYEAMRTDENPRLLTGLSHNLGQIAKVSGITAVQWVGFYIILTYMQTYMAVNLGIGKETASLATLLTLLVTALLVPVFGRLSDRVGRRPLILISSIGLVLVPYPVLRWMELAGDSSAIVGQMFLGVLLAPMLGCVFACLAELFPPAVRVTGFSIGYNVTGALLGGTAPYFATAVIASSGNHAVPAFMLMIAAVITTATVLLSVEETARADLRTQ
jgi:MHS family proline/betaine transporter-like MFS transporter